MYRITRDHPPEGHKLMGSGCAKPCAQLLLLSLQYDLVSRVKKYSKFELLVLHFCFVFSKRSLNLKKESEKRLNLWIVVHVSNRVLSFTICVCLGTKVRRGKDRHIKPSTTTVVEKKLYLILNSGSIIHNFG